MLTIEHEAVIRLFQERPDLAAGLLARSLDVQLPEFDYAAVESADLTEVTPASRQADSVIVFRRKRPGADPEPVVAVIVEVQRGRDPGKLWSWPMYQVPVITDPRQAADDIELAMLSVIHHATTPQGPDILNALFAALHNLDRDQGGMYAEMVRAALPREIWDHLVRHMKTESYEYLSDWARENIAKGQTEGKTDAILTVLAARGIEVPDELNDKIRKCRDLDRLDAWIRAAATVQSADALLDDDL
ncbi:hypothetical protein AB0C10_08900 [Microbispora amethystogenes]|uniref:hypothetical protein n=1 Tax=Microbispora amethystogenes TaxID=1427754 RepID=UPI0033C3786D